MSLWWKVLIMEYLTFYLICPTNPRRVKCFLKTPKRNDKLCTQSWVKYSYQLKSSLYIDPRKWAKYFALGKSDLLKRSFKTWTVVYSPWAFHRSNVPLHYAGIDVLCFICPHRWARLRKQQSLNCGELATPLDPDRLQRTTYYSMPCTRAPLKTKENELPFSIYIWRK
jgi:hypothetical protein